MLDLKSTVVILCVVFCFCWWIKSERKKIHGRKTCRVGNEIFLENKRNLSRDLPDNLSGEIGTCYFLLTFWGSNKKQTCGTWRSRQTCCWDAGMNMASSASNNFNLLLLVLVVHF